MAWRDHPFLNADAYRDLLEEIGPLRSLGANETGPLVRAACDSAMRIAAARPDREEVLAYQDPVAPDSLGLWRRLRAARPSRWWKA